MARARDSRWNSWWRLLGGGFVFLAFSAVGYAGLFDLPHVDISIEGVSPGGYEPASGELPEGSEVALVYFGKASCGHSNHPDVIQAVRNAKRMLSARSASAGWTFSTLGVALDWRVETGLDHLRKFGPFDEVAAGRNWLNGSAMRYIWRDLPGRPATPQLLVLRRRVGGGPGPVGAFLVEGETVVLRKVGRSEIERWVAAGAPVPVVGVGAGTGVTNGGA